MKSALFSVGLALLFLVTPGAARAQQLNRQRAALWGEDLHAAAKAAKALGRMKTPAALDLLMETLKLGAPTTQCKAKGRCGPSLAVTMVDAIGAHRSARAFKLLRVFARHRDAQVRAHAIRAIGQIRDARFGARVRSTVARALSDRDVQVRMAGAWVIAYRVKNHLSLPGRAALEGLLLALLDRGDRTASAIGLAAIGGYQTARHLALRLRKIPERTVATIYRALLIRRDFGPDPIRQWIVRALAELKGEHSTEALANYAANPPAPGLKSVVMANEFMER